MKPPALEVKQTQRQLGRLFFLCGVRELSGLKLEMVVVFITSAFPLMQKIQQD